MTCKGCGSRDVVYSGEYSLCSSCYQKYDKLKKEKREYVNLVKDSSMANLFQKN